MPKPFLTRSAMFRARVPWGKYKNKKTYGYERSEIKAKLPSIIKCYFNIKRNLKLHLNFDMEII